MVQKPQNKKNKIGAKFVRKHATVLSPIFFQKIIKLFYFSGNIVWNFQIVREAKFKKKFIFSSKISS